MLSRSLAPAALSGITLTRNTATATGTVGTVVNTGSGMIVTPATGLTGNITLTFANVQTAGVECGSLADGHGI